jgi:leucyl aminopeptidase
MPKRRKTSATSSSAWSADHPSPGARHGLRVTVPDVRLGRRGARLTRCEVVVVPVRPDAESEGATATGVGAEVVAEFATPVIAHVVGQRMSGTSGELSSVPVVPSAAGRCEELSFVGLGDLSQAAARAAGAAAGRSLRTAARAAVVWPDLPSQELATGFLESLLLAVYRPPRVGLGSKDRGLMHLTALGPWPQAVLDEAASTATMVHRARDWANTPADRLSPKALARQAERHARKSGLTARVRQSQELRHDGFGGLVAVGQGSSRPPCLVELTYEPPSTVGSPRRHVVLVGKGVTFDSGGLSLKPADAMKMMKTDMAGAAAVLATVLSLPTFDVGVRVTALLALAENLPSGSAYRPGDVLTAFGGTTIEVSNTDAEGRLVLADALAYAAQELAPDVIVDVATLTGAASVGLGRRHAALFTADDALASALVTAGERAGDRVWRLPLVDDYRPALESTVADVCHVTKDPRLGGGAITAALFLQKFVGDVPWAHLDIAGPARAEADEQEVTRGATGFGARLLLRWLRDGAPA